MKKILLALSMLLLGCNSHPAAQPQAVAETGPVTPKYQIVYVQTVELDGTNRWLGVLRNNETLEEYIIIEGSEMRPYTMVKR